MGLGGLLVRGSTVCVAAGIAEPVVEGLAVVDMAFGCNDGIVDEEETDWIGENPREC